jgi:tRNA (cytidine/uridine-2'-O-)-methyltransferase
MFNLILYEPEIPPNTGNIIRLCANTGTLLHLIQPLGFELDDKKLRRAGLDYREFTDIRVHDSLDHCLEALGRPRTLAISTRGKTSYGEHRFRPGDTLLFGPETRGLPEDLLQSMDPAHVLRIPMLAQSRSLNLSNAAAVVLYEAWRQQGFATGC